MEDEKQKKHWWHVHGWELLAFLLMLVLFGAYTAVYEFVLLPYAPSWLSATVLYTKRGMPVPLVLLVGGILFLGIYYISAKGKTWKQAVKATDKKGFDMKRLAMVELLFLILSGLILLSLLFI